MKKIAIAVGFMTFAQLSFGFSPQVFEQKGDVYTYACSPFDPTVTLKASGIDNLVCVNPKTFKTPSPVPSPNTLAPMSFRRLITESKNDFIQNSCAKAMRKIYKSGKDFKSQLVTQDAFKITFWTGKKFHHWTNSSQLIEIAKKNDVYAIFEYLRSTFKSPWNSVFYVASNKRSSSEFGQFRFDVKMHKDTLVLDESPGTKSAVINEIYGLYPELQGSEGCVSREGMDLLYFTAVEDSGVDLIRYEFPRSWFYFQVINPHAIKTIKRGK